MLLWGTAHSRSSLHIGTVCMFNKYAFNVEQNKHAKTENKLNTQLLSSEQVLKVSSVLTYIADELNLDG